MHLMTINAGGLALGSRRGGVDPAPRPHHGALGGIYG
jgi:hypothetical protein